ncbi:hypothetical protein AX16_010397 [Volvariella volvacea WC 439]|nr:hypothetical protein AX16_010397 [Volvariella volvacea WC 439]
MNHLGGELGDGGLVDECESDSTTNSSRSSSPEPPPCRVRFNLRHVVEVSDESDEEGHDNRGDVERSWVGSTGEAGGDGGEGDSDDGDDYNDYEVGDLPPAFEESPTRRNFYIRTFLGSAFEGMTHAAAHLMLDGFAITTQALEGDEPDAIAVARTILTVERRLGVSTDGFITYLFVCDICWKA